MKKRTFFTATIILFLLTLLFIVSPENSPNVITNNEQKVVTKPKFDTESIMDPKKGGEELKIEAETATFTANLSILTESSGYSGSGYVGQFEHEDDSITFTLDSPNEALYNLKVGYGALYGTDKVVNVLANGESQGSFVTTNEGFNEASSGKILVKKGSNTISLTPNWTHFAIDYIKLTPSPAPTKHEVGKNLINPKATEETKALVSYIVAHFGKSILSGQQVSPNDGLADVTYIEKTTGKMPAILGLDFVDNSPSRVENGTSANEIPKAIDWSNQGGIVAFSWHWNAPKDLIDTKDKPWWRGFYTDATTFDLEYALNNPDSEDYRLLIRDIDVISEELKKLQEADVPVLWRPLHEAEGGWFWWGAKGPEPTKELWKIMYDRMTNHHKLNNLIWVWNSIDKDWYPGDTFVDIVTFDSYPGAHNYNPASSQFEALVDLSSNKKLVAMGENGPIPDPDLLSTYHANYSYFTTWDGEILRDENSVEHLQKVYNHEYVITLDELPDLKEYKEDQ